MKLTKEDNPFDVQAGQKWKSRSSEFIIQQIEECLNGIFAAADYGGAHRMISLLRFGEYVKCK